VIKHRIPKCRRFSDGPRLQILQLQIGHRYRPEAGIAWTGRAGQSHRAAKPETTTIAVQNSRSKGWVRGEPLRFVRGHANRTKSRPPLCEDDFDVEDRGHETPCWILKGFTTNKGYGKVTIAGQRLYAHRAMYEQSVGPIPDGLDLDHLCRQTKCIRPDHLEPVTRARNLQRGNGTKLTEDQVRTIREVPVGLFTTKELAAMYGISESHMSRVRRGVKFVLSD